MGQSARQSRGCIDPRLIHLCSHTIVVRESLRLLTDMTAQAVMWQKQTCIRTISSTDIYISLGGLGHLSIVIHLTFSPLYRLARNHSGGTHLSSRLKQ
ncbi:unnamed protein product [Periconia digitata]|uniref:Uncharacterized protein n=1 Tax=Periconia digitata TaxID=1303443 RepID=A0A9W4UIJ7_9PLEO|nr:unnamed protein product [Periconia digitata]